MRVVPAGTASITKILEERAGIELIATQRSDVWRMSPRLFCSAKTFRFELALNWKTDGKQLRTELFSIGSEYAS